MDILQRFRGQTSTAGLDIGNHSLKLVKVNHKKGGHQLLAAGVQALPPGTIEGSEIKNRDALIDNITTLINNCDPTIVEVAISMSGQGIISDKVTFKIDPNENAEEMILWEAGQRSPFDVDDITLDYKILHRKAETNEVEVLLVAAKNQIMQNYIDLLYEAGLKPIIVDVVSFAMNNCYALESGNSHEEGVVALVNIGHNLTNVTFVKDGVYHSSRDISTACDFYAKTLQRNLGIGTEEAINILKGRTNQSLDANSLRQSLDYASEELSTGIDLAFSYFKTSEKNDAINKIVLSGGGAYIPNIASILEKRHQTTVQISNPMAFLEFDQASFHGLDPKKNSAIFTVAVGLGLRKVAD
jgi:type IV pilus assembly protein PilM